MGMADGDRFHPETIGDWHDWLAANHDRGDGVWVVLGRAVSGNPRLGYEELIREALCWGWVDGQSKPLDELRSMLWFTKRKPNSPWAASNKARVAELERAGRLQPSGIAEIDRAKANGNWTILDSVEALQEPAELAGALDAAPAARIAWDAFPASVRKMALGSIALAKQDTTRARRIAQIVEKAARGERPV
ncbi:MAG TPA: YdeI/OmpD-associated family protein [Propionicimonas sp.]|nr:YdeI/OmpD-associated family protein [Propionicimonas sp.]HRA07285.1 YdeI/OmpD-associated family protein [Propionicimonas sp.]